MVQFDWNERKCPKKGTEDFNDEFRKQFGNEGQAARKATKQKTSGAKESATAAAKGASQAADAIADMGTQAKKAAKEAAPSKLARITAPFRHLAAGAAGKVNDAAEHLTKDVPQTLGHVISDALPSSSRKQSSGKPAASTATNSSAQPVGKSAAQVAQDAIIAMSPGRSSGVGKRAASSKKQEEPPFKRTSRHSAAAARPSAVVVDDNDDDVDIGGDDLPEKVSQILHAAFETCKQSIIGGQQDHYYGACWHVPDGFGSCLQLSRAVSASQSGLPYICFLSLQCEPS